jgi:hypothetical protein
MALNQTMADDLAPFAQMVVDQSRGVTVGDLAFASAQDFWSTGGIPLATLTLNANSEVQLFSKNVGETGQGFTVPLTISETNNVNGDRMPSNQVYIGLKVGFQVYSTSAVTSLDPNMFLSPKGVQKVTQAAAWSLNIGDGIKRFIGNVAQFPAGAGPWASSWVYNTAGLIVAAAANLGTNGVSYSDNGAPFASELRSLPLPVIFPPNIRTDIRIQTGTAVTLTADDCLSGAVICYRMTFRGYMMTLPA